MNDRTNTLQKLAKRDYPIIIRRTADGYSACVSSLGIVVSEATVDACHARIEESKSRLFNAAVDSGFGDVFLAEPTRGHGRSGLLRMALVVVALSVVLLIVLIPTTYLAARIERLVPSFAETAMDVVQRRVRTMSDDEQRKLSMIAGRACPAIDELMEARCRNPRPAGGESGKVPR